MSMEKTHELFDGEMLDAEVVPLVRYFNSVGLPTRMSCQGHNETNMSMFWIEFDSSVAEEHIIEFQRKHANKYGGFCCNGRFVMRILANATGIGSGVERTYQYMAATIKAAHDDLERWKRG
ncbi:hypothetical protein [Flavonifractor plautii]|uniref:hypothetical protein n=1 Tax=Flavonifractor plautii TaxID=292800 RepID=UPI0018AB495E|nr:hypothetical protein [Flavonifractor plautii]